MYFTLSELWVLASHFYITKLKTLKRLNHMKKAPADFCSMSAICRRLLFNAKSFHCGFSPPFFPQNVWYWHSISFQEEVEGTVLSLFDLYDKRSEIDPDCPLLLRQKHVLFLKKNLIHLPESFQVCSKKGKFLWFDYSWWLNHFYFQCLDSSRPWLAYWALHSLALLEETLDSEDYSKISVFLSKYVHAH